MKILMGCLSKKKYRKSIKVVRCKEDYQLDILTRVYYMVASLLESKRIPRILLKGTLWCDIQIEFVIKIQYTN